MPATDGETRDHGKVVCFDYGHYTCDRHGVPLRECGCDYLWANRDEVMADTMEHMRECGRKARERWELAVLDKVMALMESGNNACP